jgi:hypothetical protein
MMVMDDVASPMLSIKPKTDRDTGTNGGWRHECTSQSCSAATHGLEQLDARGRQLEIVFRLAC